jgi:hypothetical protein
MPSRNDDRGDGEEDLERAVEGDDLQDDEDEPRAVAEDADLAGADAWMSSHGHEGDVVSRFHEGEAGGGRIRKTVGQEMDDLEHPLAARGPEAGGEVGDGAPR